MWSGGGHSSQPGWQYQDEDRGMDAWSSRLARHGDMDPIPAHPGHVQHGWEPQDFDPRYPDAGRQRHLAHEQYQQQYPSAYPPPVHTTTIQSRAPGASHFHPYQQPKSRPLLFVNTVPPPQASSGPAFTPDVVSQMKPKRKRISPEQLTALTGLFDRTDSPSFDLRESLGVRLGMSNREVQVWFQNRRAKMNRLKTQGNEGVPLKPSPVPHPNAFASSSYPPREEIPPVNPHQRFAPTQWNPPPPGPAVAAPASDVSMHGQLSAFRIPTMPPPPLPLPPQPVRSAPEASSSSQREPPPSSPLPPSHTLRSFAGPEIDILARSPSLPASFHSSPYRMSDYPFTASPTFSLPAQFGGSAPSPAPSSLGSLGWPSPAFSSSGSSLFSSSNADSIMSPYTPASMSSPTGFLRFNLESPRTGSPRIGSPRCDTDQFPREPVSGSTTPSQSPDPASLIRLPPINSAGWARTGGAAPTAARPRGTSTVHRRSSSDSGPRSTKLPPIQGLVDSIGLPRSPNFSLSAPNSPVDSLKSLPDRGSPPPPRPSPSLSTSRMNHLQRRSNQRPSSLSNILPRTEEEPHAMMQDGEGEPLGLGMLAVASEYVEENDGRQAIFEQARRMSYDVNAHRDGEN